LKFIFSFNTLAPYHSSLSTAPAAAKGADVKLAASAARPFPMPHARAVGAGGALAIERSTPNSISATATASNLSNCLSLGTRPFHAVITLDGEHSAA
jgi:hypothetical protein